MVDSAGTTRPTRTSALDEYGPEVQPDVIFLPRVFTPGAVYAPAKRFKRQATSRQVQSIHIGFAKQIPEASNRRSFLFSSWTHAGRTKKKIGRAVQQECRDRSRMPSSA
eukprot:TRINITY_DN24424_c0_g2_i1.p1 TRINITY_DN24424_c0_g2~~TRINITY_DN24424_c0_g2_i1.p1  ORF type:complete len:109 (-),score=12.41 TRINITY_DN24424_c0_g2_i1:11-337(-)